MPRRPLVEEMVGVVARTREARAGAGRLLAARAGGHEYDPDRVHRVLGLPRYHHFYMGKPITTMSYDWWVGRRGNRFDGTRFTLQEIFLSTLTNFLYDDGRPPAGDPSWWGVQKKQAIARWASRIELLAQVEDTQDGVFYAAPPQGDAERPNADQPEDSESAEHGGSEV